MLVDVVTHHDAGSLFSSYSAVEVHIYVAPTQVHKQSLRCLYKLPRCCLRRLCTWHVIIVNECKTCFFHQYNNIVDGSIILDGLFRAIFNQYLQK